MSNVFGFRQPPPGFITEYHGGGGKGGTTTQSVSIPPEVLARYNAVNARAEDTAKQPFQPYGGQFVAGLTPTQQAGQAATSAYSQTAQPYFGAATDLTLSGARDVGPLTQDQISYYQNPAMLATLAPTQAALQQQQGQQLAQQQAEAIRGGAFGGGRDKMQRDILRGQQQLGMGQALAPIYQQAYQTGLSTAQQQQGVVAQDLARRMQAGQQIAGLGTGAQQAALQGAQAQMAAGQVEQQTQQADLTARYQQFLQERGYPFQVAQFLANIAMGTGALSGSTTTTQQPGGFFSDKRLKKDVKEIGETHDGQPIYSYKYNGDDRTQIGLMAQDVEKKHPEAVGLMGGYKTVDYKKATEGAERTHKDMGGGLMPDGFDPNSMGGAVTSDMAGEGFMRGGYVGGGLVGNDDWSQIVAANKQALGVYGGAQPMGGAIGAGGIVPQASVPVPKLITAGAAPQQRPTGLSTAMQTGKDIASTYKGGKEFLLGAPKSGDTPASAGLIGGGGSTSGKSWFGEAKDWLNSPSAAHGGLIVPRHAYADGGMSEADEAIPYDPSDVMGGKDPMEGVLKSGEHKIEPLKPAQAPGGSGGGPGLLGTVAQGIGTINALGSAGSWLGSTAIPFLFAKDGGRIAYEGGGLVPRQGYDFGGLIPREHHDGEDGNVVGDAPKYLISPQNKEEMDPHWQTLINRIYGGEGGYDPSGQPRYNIRQGGKETFDIEAGHPGKRPAQGGVSSAAGAGQFINDTWNRVTGGAPMTKGYQDAATKELAAQDYKARTGRDLDADLREQGLAPNIIKTLSPTWTSLNGAPSPPGLVGRGLQPDAPPSGGEGKKSLGDIVTSEGFVVPALGFLGSMLASNRPSFGGALGEGIVGGVGAYQKQQQLASELAKRGAETELTKAEVPRTEMQTQGIKAGLFERRWIPNRGWMVYDKANNNYFFVTDANLNPVKGTGFEKTYQQIPAQGGPAAPETAVKEGTPPQPSVAGKVESDITKLAPPPKSAVDWTPVTAVPQGFEPARHMDIQMDPENAKKYLEEGAKILEGQNGKAEAAGKQRLELEQMLSSLDKLPGGLFGTTGPGAEARLRFGLALNSAGSVLGGKPLTDEQVLAAQEQIKKGSFRLGAALANSIGSREPGFIVAQSVSANPTIENSKEGFKLLAAGLRESARYDEDKAKFYDSYMAQFKHLSGAKEAFEKLNPPELYAQKAVIAAVDPTVIEDLRRYGPEQMRGLIDKKYGNGITNILMGKK
jgi:muramidase (phage lysozyme)